MNDKREFTDIPRVGAELLQRASIVLPHPYDGVEKTDMLRASYLFDTLVKRCAVERGVLECVAEASRFRWQPVEFKRMLLARFYALEREHFGVYDRPQNCEMCDENCSAEMCCICLSSDFQLYACVRHASVHECASQQSASYKRCPCTRINAQTEEVCVFSGKVVGVHLMSGAGGSKDFSSDDAHVRSKAGFQFRMSMEEFENVRDAFSNADAGTSSLHHPVFDLLRDPDGDDAGGETSGDESSGDPSSVRGSKRASRAASPDSRSTSKRRRGAAAASSADQLTPQRRAQLNESNYFEFRKTQIIEEAQRYLRSIAEDVINHILFDDEVRRLLNEEQIFRVSGEMTRSLKQYHAAKKRAFEMPVWTECLAAFYTPQIKLKLLRLVAYDRAQIERFCDFAVSRWQLCFGAPAAMRREVTPCMFKKFALALLYAMRTGLSIPVRGSAWTETDACERIVVVPRDETLCVDLPDENLLRFFGHQARDALREKLAKGKMAGTTTPTPHHHGSGPRGPRIERIPQRIEINGIGSVMCRSFLPPWLQDDVLGEALTYTPSDITSGLDFFKQCVASYDEDARQTLKFT